MGDVIDEAPTRSPLERKFLQLCRRHRIPPPKVNVPVGRFVVDFLWLERRLIVEVDGYEYHRARVVRRLTVSGTPSSCAAGIGCSVMYRQVTQQPSRVAAAVSDLLSSSA